MLLFWLPKGNWAGVPKRPLYRCRSGLITWDSPLTWDSPQIWDSPFQKKQLFSPGQYKPCTGPGLACFGVNDLEYLFTPATIVSEASRILRLMSHQGWVIRRRLLEASQTIVAGVNKYSRSLTSKQARPLWASSTCFLKFPVFASNSKTERPIKLKSKIDQFWFLNFFWWKIFFRNFFFSNFFKNIGFFGQLLQQYELLLELMFFTPWKGEVWGSGWPNHIEKIIII